MSETIYFTQEGLQKLKDEIHYLKTVERKKITQQIAEARDKGDLSENAEYDAAKEAQGLMEARIANLVSNLSNARLVDETKIDTSRVLILSTVKLRNNKNKAEMKYTLVAENEADFKSNKISWHVALSSSRVCMNDSALPSANLDMVLKSISSPTFKTKSNLKAFTNFFRLMTASEK